MRPKREVRPVKGREVARIAERQHGVISLRQLRAIGFSDGAVKRWLLSGRLHQIHRGVYSVGHAGISERGLWLATVLAGPPGTVLSHRSAATLWGLLPKGTARVDVIAPAHLRSNGRHRVHHCWVGTEEVTRRFGFPVTAIPRTLIDVGAVAPHLLARAFNEAQVQGLLSTATLSESIATNRGRRGVARLRAIAEIGEVGPGRSELERRFLALIGREGLPRPETGVLLEAGAELLECDCLWRRQRLIVELDGRRYHDTAIAFERDRARDRRLQAAGWQVVRVTWSQLRDPEPLLTDLRQLLLGRTQP